MAKVELLYFWVEEYKILKKVGFNFSNKYIIKFNPETNELLIEDNPNYVEDLFNYDVKEADKDHGYITNITALVGKNTVGKTTLLECLMEKYSEKIKLKPNFKSGRKIGNRFF